MSNKFKLWVDQNYVNNTQSYDAFLNDTQRQEGFKAGTPASAIRVNTTLRQSSLITCALMNVLAPNDNNVDFRSSVDAVSEVMTEGFTHISVGKVNGLEIKRDDDGVLKIGDTIIPQKKVLWEGSFHPVSGWNPDVTISENVTENDNIEISFYLNNTSTGKKYFTVKMILIAQSSTSIKAISLPCVTQGSDVGGVTVDFRYDSSTDTTAVNMKSTLSKILLTSGGSGFTGTDSTALANEIYFTKIVKVIE